MNIRWNPLSMPCWALGVLIVFLSSSLIANTLSGLLNQHLRHIGVMKLIGGQNRIIFRMYLVLLLIFGALALVIAVPAGGQGAYSLAQFVADKMGFTLLGYRFVPLSLALQVAVGILVPPGSGGHPRPPRGWLCARYPRLPGHRPESPGRQWYPEWSGGRPRRQGVWLPL